jgi:hypothetical protein
MGRRFVYRMDAYLRVIQEQVPSEKFLDRSLESTVDPSIAVMMRSPIGTRLRELSLAMDRRHEDLPLIMSSADTIGMIRTARSIVRMAQCPHSSHVPPFSVDRDNGFPKGHVSPGEVELWLRKLSSIRDIPETLKDYLGNIRALLEMIFN